MQVTFNLTELERDLDAETREIVLELSSDIVNEMKEEAPVGATGDLRRNIQIFQRGNDEVLLGTRVHYAEDVVDGTEPHHADFDQIQIWARRVLGDESAAGAVWRHIAQEGTEPNDFVSRSIEAAVRDFSI